MLILRDVVLTWNLVIGRAALWQFPGEGAILEVQARHAARLVCQAILDGRPQLASLAWTVAGAPTLPGIVLYTSP